MSENLVSFAEWLEAQEDGGLLPTSKVKERFRRAEAERPVKWRSLSDAASIMGESEKRVRAWCPRWLALADPPVRVRKAGSKPKSPWELDEAGCFRWRENKGLRPVSLVTENAAVDSEEALLDHWGTLATAGMDCPERKKSSGATRSDRRASTA